MYYWIDWTFWAGCFIQGNDFLNLKISAPISFSSRHTTKVGLSTDGSYAWTLDALMLGLWTFERLESGGLDNWSLKAWTLDACRLEFWILGLSTLKFCTTGCLDAGRLHDWTIRLWTLGLWTPGRLNNKLTFNKCTLTTKEIL